METRNRYQVGHPQRTQVVPIGLAKATSIAQCQRLDEAAAVVLDRAGDRVGLPLAPRRQARRLAQWMCPGGLAHVPTARHPLPQCIALGVEPARVHQATRRPDPHAERPALAGPQRAPAIIGGATESVVPAQRQIATAESSGHRRIFVNPEAEAGSPGTVVGEADHPPVQHVVDGGAAGCQLLGEPGVAVEGRPAETEEGRAEEAQAGGQDPDRQASRYRGPHPLTRQ